MFGSKGKKKSYFGVCNNELNKFTWAKEIELIAISNDQSDWTFHLISDISKQKRRVSECVCCCSAVSWGDEVMMWGQYWNMTFNPFFIPMRACSGPPATSRLAYLCWNWGSLPPFPARGRRCSPRGWWCNPRCRRSGPRRRRACGAGWRWAWTPACCGTAGSPRRRAPSGSLCTGSRLRGCT